MELVQAVVARKDGKALVAAWHAVMVAMVTIVINHVTGVYLIPVTKNMVSVQIHLDVNLDGNTDRRSVIYHANQDNLDITVPKLATVSTNHVILLRVNVLLVDVNVGIQAVTVVQNVPVVTMDLIVKTSVINATVLYVNDLKEIVHMDALKATQDTSVYS